ncbi:MAG TPA: DUF5777 family beta-barrel protein [Acidobacteriota bacterium]|nr:DUF5777 family beta-barrel protein [Acidobacteriota bacterium]
MKLALRAFVVFSFCFTLLGFPKYLQRFTQDPLSSPKFQNQCATCHIDPKGGSPRNEFGEAFDANDFTITPDLRARFPERFQYPIQVIDAHTEIHYSDPTNKTVVLKRDGTATVIDPANPPKSGTAVAGRPAQPAAAGAPKAAAPTAAQSGRISDWEKPMQISNRFLNLPQPMPIQRNDMNFLVQHRFSAELFQGSRSAERLFGLDSTANIVFGFDYGVWDRVMASVYRARNDRTIEMDITGDLLHQQRGDPISLAANIGVEGQNNFHGFHSPHIQLLVEREFNRYVTAMAAPTVIFNSVNNEQLEFLRDFAANPDKDYTVNMGVGLSLKVRPSIAILGEYVPRVAGFRGFFVDRPAVSVGLQKQTFHHVFTLVLSTSTEMSPARYGPNVGSNTTNRFKIGFNIFRKLR